MTSQEVDYSNYYDINGDKICDNKGERIFVHFLGLHIQDLETGQRYRANGSKEIGKMFTLLND